MPALFLNIAFLTFFFATVLQTASAQEVYDNPSNYALGVEAFQEGDYRRAFDAWSLGSYEGNAEAQYNLGVLYLEGQGVKVDVDQARAWFTKAAYQNHPEAQYNLGHMSLSGLGMEKDVAAAVLWWKRAAEGGYAQAQFNYGRALYLGIEGHADKQGGLLFIQQAALQKDTRALKFLENNVLEVAQIKRQNIEEPAPETVASINSDTPELIAQPSVSSLPDPGTDTTDLQLMRDDQAIQKDYIIRSANVAVAIYTQADFLTSMGQLRPGALLKVKSIKGNKAQVSVAGGISLAVGRADNRPSIQPRYGWIEAKNLAYSGETAQQLKEAWQKKIAAASAHSPVGVAKPASSVVNIRARGNQDYAAQVVALEDVETSRVEPDTKQYKVNDNVWLFTQDKDAYAIQLFSLLNIEKAHTISKQASFRDRAHLYTAQINNKQWAILLLGPYANAAAAEVAHQALPADYAGLGIVRLISRIASQRCAIRDRLDAGQLLGLDAFCL